LSVEKPTIEKCGKVIAEPKELINIRKEGGVSLKWLYLLVFVNAIMLVMFVSSDYWTWMDVHGDMEITALVAAQHSGKLYNITTGVDYGILFRKMWITGWYETSTGLTFPRAGSHAKRVRLNLPFIMFAVTIALNLWLVSKMQREYEDVMNTATQSSKTARK